MIWHGYLDIDYNGRLPMIVFSEMGWELYKPQYVRELLDKMQHTEEADSAPLINRLKSTNREVVILILRAISENRTAGLIGFLEKWAAGEVKKVKAMIKETVSSLE